MRPHSPVSRRRPSATPRTRRRSISIAANAAPRTASAGAARAAQAAANAVADLRTGRTAAAGKRAAARAVSGSASQARSTSPLRLPGARSARPGAATGARPPRGSDLAATPALVPHQRGTASSELSPGGVHVLATIDYAATANLLVGVRLGYVANAYPGDAAASAGKTFAAAIHAEARGTWVFGDEPIARSGLAPYVFVAAGVAHFDAPVTVMIAQQGVAGERAVHAWFVSGPAFGGVGGGARYAFSPRNRVSRPGWASTRPSGRVPSVSPYLRN